MATGPVSAPTSVREALEAACARGAWVRVERTIADGWIDGHVVDVGPVWFVMDVLDDAIRFGGFEAHRLQDVAEVTTPHPRRRFYDKALKLRGERRPARRGLTAWTLPQVVRWAEAQHGLITVYRELVEPDACWIGVPRAVDDRDVVLQEVTPDGTWEPEPATHALADLTQVGFGGAYEQALALVAGPPPGWNPRRAWPR